MQFISDHVGHQARGWLLAGAEHIKRFGASVRINFAHGGNEVAQERIEIAVTFVERQPCGGDGRDALTQVLHPGADEGGFSETSRRDDKGQSTFHSIVENL